MAQYQEIFQPIEHNIDGSFELVKVDLPSGVVAETLGSTSGDFGNSTFFRGGSRFSDSPFTVNRAPIIVGVVDQNGTENNNFHSEIDASGFLETRIGSLPVDQVHLIGYWINPDNSYFHKRSTWTAGGDVNAWTVKDLTLQGTSGTPGNALVEIVAHTLTAPARIGIRPVGSDLERFVDIHSGSGLTASTVTFIVNANENAEVEFYGSVADASFSILGHWLNKPGTYTELMEDLPLPSEANSFVQIQLPRNKVGSNDVVQIMMQHKETSIVTMGARAVGSNINRINKMAPARDGSYIGQTWHVNLSNSEKIEVFTSQLSNVKFTLIGVWDVGEAIGLQQQLLGATTGLNEFLNRHMKAVRVANGPPARFWNPGLDDPGITIVR